tara:strand:- start:1176 stop:1526 length:351 start_codon:yes stop_codon:yes gene_type:complete
MPFEISGIIKEVFEVQTFANDFKKREFLLTTENGKYPQEIIFGCLKDRIELLNNVKAGDQAKVHFDIACREWNEKYFVNLNAWKIDVAQGEASNAAPADSNTSNPSDVILDEEPPF